MLDRTTMELTINGEARRFDADRLTVTELVERLGFGDRRVAVEVNRELVKRAGWDERVVSDGDAVEVVHFVGGGR